MKQQINLYQESRREKKTPLCFAHMATLLVVALLLLLMVGTLQQRRLTAQETDMKQLQQQQETLIQQLSELQALATRPKSRLLELEISRLSTRRDSLLPLLDHFAEQVLEEQTGFSVYLSGLARQSFESLWLSRIHLAQGGFQMTLSGSARQPEDIPRYLQRLERENAFAGRDFKRMQLAREEGAKNIDFSLLSTLGGTP